MNRSFHLVFFFLLVFIFFSGNSFEDKTSFSVEEIFEIILEKENVPLTRVEKIYQAKKNYFKILSSREELAIAEEVKSHFQKAVLKAQEDFDEGNGDISQLAITKLKLGLSGTLNDIAALKSNIEQARISLAQLIEIKEVKTLSETKFKPENFEFSTIDNYVSSLENSGHRWTKPKLKTLMGDLRKAFIRLAEVREKMRLAQKAKKMTRALLVTEAANYDFGIGDSEDLFEALIIYTRVARGYFRSIYDFNMAVADIERLN
tara:strand:+ start:57 stop:839 length:783 start_codon:yes stop_codon:yes gene_type:complete